MCSCCSFWSRKAGLFTKPGKAAEYFAEFENSAARPFADEEILCPVVVAVLRSNLSAVSFF
jgi:hypothetical protein